MKFLGECADINNKQWSCVLSPCQVNWSSYGYTYKKGSVTQARQHDLGIKTLRSVIVCFTNLQQEAKVTVATKLGDLGLQGYVTVCKKKSLAVKKGSTIFISFSLINIHVFSCLMALKQF